ncbi:hypothetical protein RHGRI_026196 [Rhododendron griersonianum]|uniref:CCHC-type domain-containing protein n=1 Tax=Rhododendron griersonianum TaxID=479676 RepID=A0AAV6IVB6_9ERIC|nr:hypothetical protein RHGRI_026196 [Rhododendron griersonianum]
MPSLYEVFATIDREERRRRIVQPQGLLPTPDSSPVTYQMAFAASSSSRPPSGKIICYHCNESGHVKARCFKLHPELKQQFTRNRLSSYSSPSGPSRTAALAEKTGSFQVPTHMDYSHLQSQIGQLQEQLGNLNARAQGTSHTSSIADILLSPSRSASFAGVLSGYGFRYFLILSSSFF